MVIDSLEKRMRNVVVQGVAVGPGNVVELILVGNSGFTTEHIAGHIDHRAPGGRVDAFAEYLGCLDDESGFFSSFADRRVFGVFARLEFASWELPRQAAFLDAPTDEQETAFVHDDGGRYGRLRGCIGHSAVSTSSRIAG